MTRPGTASRWPPRRWTPSASNTSSPTPAVAALRNLVVLLARVGADEAAALIDAALPPAALFPAEATRLARARAAVAERLGPAALAAVRDRAAAITAAELIDEATAALERAVAVA